LINQELKTPSIDNVFLEYLIVIVGLREKN